MSRPAKYPKVLTFRITKEMKAFFQAAAKKRDISLSTFLRDAINAELKRMKL